MDYNVDLGALASAAIGAVGGAAFSAFRSGRAWERVEGNIKLLSEILSRVETRLGDLERRYNIDGEYTSIHRRRGLDFNP